MESFWVIIGSGLVSILAGSAGAYYAHELQRNREIKGKIFDTRLALYQSVVEHIDKEFIELAEISQLTGKAPPLDRSESNGVFGRFLLVGNKRVIDCFNDLQEQLRFARKALYEAMGQKKETWDRLLTMTAELQKLQTTRSMIEVGAGSEQLRESTSKVLNECSRLRRELDELVPSLVSALAVNADKRNTLRIRFMREARADLDSFSVPFWETKP